MNEVSLVDILLFIYFPLCFIAILITAILMLLLKSDIQKDFKDRNKGGLDD